MNFVDRLLANGFVRKTYKWDNGRVFNSSNGWMGLTVYHPYEMFEKGGSMVELSLERYGVTDLLIHSNGRNEVVDVNEKEVKITIDGEVIYANKNGVLPPIEIEQKLY